MRVRVGVVGRTVILGSLMATGCAGSRPVEDGAVSQSGGFSERASRFAEATEQDAEYCAAERLRWRFSAGVLSLVDARVVLECNGQRSMSVERVDGLVEITERDVPHEGLPRSGSTCAFDFAASLHINSPDPVFLRLFRDVTDIDSGPALVWQGELHGGDEQAQIALVDSPSAPRSCREPRL